jgi:hypothetical protein
MGDFDVKPALNGKVLSIDELYEYCSEHSEVRHWQGDMFVKRNNVVAEIFEPCVQHGDVGVYNDWYVVYNSFAPWYANIKENIRMSHYRYEAMMDGTYYKEIEV